MRRLLERMERNKANPVGLARFFERPANTRITRQPRASIGRPFENCNGDGQRKVSPKSSPLFSAHLVGNDNENLATGHSFVGRGGKNKLFDAFSLAVTVLLEARYLL
ncbi:MAG: hypothetical protein U1E20_11995 [Methylocystis sp.]|uniref:hypothetical protein n=1 Tax=Methylocystis sp. TaxID=1911079 RepID=UPI0039338E38